MQQSTLNLKDNNNNEPHCLNTFNNYSCICNVNNNKARRVYLPARHTQDDYDNVINYECIDSE
jgi:hypothetical protein